MSKLKLMNFREWWAKHCPEAVILQETVSMTTYRSIEQVAFLAWTAGSKIGHAHGLKAKNKRQQPPIDNNFVEDGCELFTAKG